MLVITNKRRGRPPDSSAACLCARQQADCDRPVSGWKQANVAHWGCKGSITVVSSWTKMARVGGKGYSASLCQRAVRLVPLEDVRVRLILRLFISQQVRV